MQQHEKKTVLLDAEYFMRMGLEQEWQGVFNTLTIGYVQKVIWVSMRSAEHKESRARGELLLFETQLRDRMLMAHTQSKPVALRGQAHALRVELEKRASIAAEEHIIRTKTHTEHTQTLLNTLQTQEKDARSSTHTYETTDRNSLRKRFTQQTENLSARKFEENEYCVRKSIMSEERACREVLRSEQSCGSTAATLSAIEKNETFFRDIIAHDRTSKIRELWSTKINLHVTILLGLEQQWRRYFESIRNNEMRDLASALTLGCPGKLTGTAIFALEQAEHNEAAMIKTAQNTELSGILQSMDAGKASIEKQVRATAREHLKRHKLQHANQAAAESMFLSLSTEQRVQRGVVIRSENTAWRDLAQIEAFERSRVKRIVARPASFPPRTTTDPALRHELPFYQSGLREHLVQQDHLRYLTQTLPDAAKFTAWPTPPRPYTVY